MDVFFFQAEDGIRVLYVTGVQTCALPISIEEDQRPARHFRRARLEEVAGRPLVFFDRGSSDWTLSRSEERRVGKECGSLGPGEQSKENVDACASQTQTYDT